MSGRWVPEPVRRAGRRVASWRPNPPGTGTPGAATLGARGSAWMALGALLVALVVAPFGVEVGGGDFGRLVDGALEVEEADGWRQLEVPSAVPAGAQLRVGDQDARIEVDGGLLTLGEGTELLADPSAPQVHHGSLLVEAEQPLRARVGATTAEGRGAWRVDVGVASRIATYRGRVEVADGGGRRDLDRFRQVAVRDGALEPGLRPVRYDADDPWDRWLLADALAVDRLAERLQASLERTYGRDPREPAFYAAFVVLDDAGLVPDLAELAVTSDDDAFGPPADILTAVAAIDALHVEAGLATPLARDRVVELRRAGATWGLVLVEHDLGAAALRAAADRSLEQVQASPPPEPPPPGPEEEDATPPPADDDAPGGTEPPAGPEPDPEEPDGSPDPGDDDPDGDDDGPLDPLEDAVRDTGDDLGDLLEDTGDAVSDGVGDTTEDVGELLEDTTDSAADTVGEVGGLLD